MIQIKVLNRLKVLAVLVLGFVVMSCSHNALFDQYVTIPDDGWNVDSMAVFNVTIDDASAAYDLTLNIRNRSTFKNSNLWLFVDVISPSGKLMQQKVNCILADDSGKWLGSGWGDLFSVEIPYQKNVRFAETGQYTIRIVQGMYDENLSGIHNVGVRVEKISWEK